MVKLVDTKGKSLSEIKHGAYYRCFGDIELGHLISRVQSLIIKNGYELENIVLQGGEENDIILDDLDLLLSHQVAPEGLYLASKKVIKKSHTIVGRGIEPDFMIFLREGNKQECYVVELKDGHEFDTKSSAKEASNLVDFAEANREHLHYWIIHRKIVGFNAGSKVDIIEGFKRKIDTDIAMTGREFCDLLKLDYDAIQDQRARDRESNVKEFIDRLYKIDAVRNGILERHNQSTSS